MSINTLWCRRRRNSKEEEVGAGGVGGQENELFVFPINPIIKKLKINKRVIDLLIISRWVCSLDFGWMVVLGEGDKKRLWCKIS